MWVESEVDLGSTFHFTIAASPAERPKPPSEQGLPSMSGKGVLVVDGHATNREILRSQLLKWGLRPELAASGPEALARLRAGEEFDLAILDMHMPDMDGLMLAAALRELRAEMPLIMLTSLGRREAAATRLGFVAFLYKPVKQSQFFDALVSALTGAAQVRPAGAALFDAKLGGRCPCS
jgi:CheY-like chemotaxis protein